MRGMGSPFKQLRTARSGLGALCVAWAPLMGQASEQADSTGQKKKKSLAWLRRFLTCMQKSMYHRRKPRYSRLCLPHQCRHCYELDFVAAPRDQPRPRARRRRLSRLQAGLYRDCPRNYVWMTGAVEAAAKKRNYCGHCWPESRDEGRLCPSPAGPAVPEGPWKLCRVATQAITLTC